MQETVCIRCGKTRVIARRWREKIKGRGTVIFHEESVCPDSECQKIVDQKFAEMRERRNFLEERKNSKIQKIS